MEKVHSTLTSMFYVYYFMHMGVFPPCVSVYCLLAGAHESKKNVLDPQELQTAVSHCMGAAN